MPTTCLIIAAGKGSRLQHEGPSKPLLPILGVPMIERVIRSALEAGADDFLVITGYHSEHVRVFLDRLNDHLPVRLTAVMNKDWEQGNGLSVLQARNYLPAPFLLLMADHLFDSAMARRLLETPLADDEIALGVDNDVNNSSIDLADVTRVKLHDGKICQIGKGLINYDGFDTGIFKCTPSIFDVLERCASVHDDTTLTGAVRALAHEGRVKAIDLSGHFWIDIDDPPAFTRAENALIAQLRDKRNDGPV